MAHSKANKHSLTNRQTRLNKVSNLNYFFGLEGVGIAFCIVYIAYLLLMSIVCIRCYDFKFSHKHIKVFANSLLFTIMAFIPLYVWGFPVAYGSGITVFLISSIYSLYELNKRIDIF